jgi:hypothetical protein
VANNRRMPPCATCGHGWSLHVIPGGVENIDIYPTERWCVEDDCRCRNYTTGCRVCGGSGFVAQKQCIDDGYGEVDSCPACDEREP